MSADEKEQENQLPLRGTEQYQFTANFEGFRLSTAATIREKDKEIERLQGIGFDLAGYIAKQLEVERPDKEHATDKLPELLFRLIDKIGKAK